MSTASQETIERLKEQAAAELLESEVVVEEEVTPAEDSPDPEKTPRDATREYVIVTGWTEVARVTAGSAEAAVLSLGEHLKEGTKYGITPSRNWHEKTPEIEHTTSVKLK